MAHQVWKSEAVPYLTPRAPQQADAWTEQDARRHSQSLVEVSEATPPADIAGALEIASGDSAVVRRRVMYVDQVPVELTDSYYPKWLAAGTALAEDRKIKGGAVTLLAELGHTITEVVEDVAAAAPTPEECKRYGIEASDPVLTLTRVSLDADGRPIEVSVMRMLRGQHLRYRTRTD